MAGYTSLRRAAAAIAMSALAIAFPGTHGQELTERFIPIGQSPGLSGKVTTIGAIQSVQGRVVTLASERGAQKFEVTDRTLIWIDRSKQKLGNTRGGIADLRPGRRAEVRPDAKNAAAAYWIKVEETGS